MEEKNKDIGIRKISDDDLSYIAGGLDTSYAKEMIKNNIISRYPEVNDEFKQNKRNTSKDPDDKL